MVKREGMRGKYIQFRKYRHLHFVGILSCHLQNGCVAESNIGEKEQDEEEDRERHEIKKCIGQHSDTRRVVIV